MPKKNRKKSAPVDSTIVDAPRSLAARLRDGIQLRVRPIPKLARTVIEEQSVDALHDLRVASRRLRAVVSLIGRTMPRRRTNSLAAKLRQLTRTLGLPREIDVNIEIIEQLLPPAAAPEDRAAIEHLLETLTARRDFEHRRMTRKLNRLKVAKLRRQILDLAQRIPESAASEDAHAADDVLAPLIENAFAGLPAVRQSERPAELHEMRIAIKRLRYAFEWLSPAAPGGFASLIQRAVALQDCIGSHHDHFRLEAWLTEIETHLDQRGRAVLSAGVCRCRERVSKERQRCYAQFLELTANLTASSVHQKARVALGLAEKRPTIGIFPHKIGG